MKVIRAFCLCWLLMLADGVSAQLVDKVLSVLGEDSVGSVTVARTDSDSIQLSLVRQELETARLNEANLRMEMEQMKLAGYAADSVKLALQKQRIDSLRTVTPGIPVVVEKDTLFYLYAKRGGHTPQQRAKDVSNVIEALGTRFNLRPDSVYLESTDIVWRKGHHFLYRSGCFVGKLYPRPAGRQQEACRGGQTESHAEGA